MRKFVVPVHNQDSVPVHDQFLLCLSMIRYPQPKNRPYGQIPRLQPGPAVQPSHRWPSPFRPFHNRSPSARPVEDP